jgi:hypothetical protein
MIIVIAERRRERDPSLDERLQEQVNVPRRIFLEGI